MQLTAAAAAHRTAPQELQQCIAALLRVDRAWLPARAGHSMYIRPFVFSDDGALGVTRSSSATLGVIMSPSGPYFKSGGRAACVLLYMCVRVRAFCRVRACGELLAAACKRDRDRGSAAAELMELQPPHAAHRALRRRPPLRPAQAPRRCACSLTPPTFAPGRAARVPTRSAAITRRRSRRSCTRPRRTAAARCGAH